jgi:serine protease inhibitor
MAGGLHVPASGRALLAGLHARTAALGRLSGPGVTLAQSNQVWADPSLTTSRRFLDDAATGYGAGLNRVPLLRRPGQVVGQVNAAIAAATRGHIAHLLKPGSLTGIGWLLTDALYLNARWATPFEPYDTSPGPFTTATGQHATATYMSGAGYSYARAAGWTAVALPYRGHRLDMIALLPDSRARGCPGLTPAALGQVTAGLRLTAGSPAYPNPVPLADRAIIQFPKLSISTARDMAGLLTRLGMGRAFTPAADFTGLSPQACCLKLVQHAATLQITEKGTVATAATAVGVVPSSAAYAPHKVAFDRPYVLLITDPATGEPLFVARIADPGAS